MLQKLANVCKSTQKRLKAFSINTLLQGIFTEALQVFRKLLHQNFCKFLQPLFYFILNVRRTSYLTERFFCKKLTESSNLYIFNRRLEGSTYRHRLATVKSVNG